jgi:hypothetical protein
LGCQSGQGLQIYVITLRCVSLETDYSPQDPFRETPDTPVLIGTAHVYLESLLYLLDIDDEFVVTDYKGNYHRFSWNQLKEESCWIQLCRRRARPPVRSNCTNDTYRDPR